MPRAYMSGFGNEFESEAKPGALPVGQNNPQKCPYGLYAEQISGSAFTAPGAHNFRSWTYRMRPSVRHMPRFDSIRYPDWVSAGVGKRTEPPLGQFRWGPVPVPEAPTRFPAGIATMTTAGDVQARDGLAIHVYAFNQSMTDDYFLNADGEMLIVPEQGRLKIHTELGILDVAPLEICVIPRGLIFRVESLDGASRGYVCENYGRLFALPERGPIGANGLANPRDFKYPVACYEDKETPCRIDIKWCGRFFRTEIEHSPLDVVAWHGNYAPYKYDLRHFCPVGAILFDHPDPSIFTVLTAASGEPGTANLDFVIFPPRWMVAEGTFRPPWFHRNIMSEFMGLILGKYDAKEEGFRPGGMSLHNMMLPHGPDRDGFEKATNADLAPEKLEETMAFMFESRLPQQMTPYAIGLETRDEDYADCWSGLERKFDGSRKGL